MLGVVGGQGFLLGRGNQQLSPAVLRAVGAGSVEVVAAPTRSPRSRGPVLHVDTDDAEPGRRASSGYRRVRTGPGRSTVLKVVA